MVSTLAFQMEKSGEAEELELYNFNFWSQPKVLH